MPRADVVQSQGRVSLVALGCAKNLVEAESMSTRLVRLGWEMTSDLPNANVVVLHTCGFLEEARNEALAAVKEIRKSSPRSFLIMTGCFAQFLGGKNPWGVDALLGTGNFQKLPDLLEARFNGGGKFKSDGGKNPGGFHDAALPRPLRPGQISTYLRVSEGCNHRCTFCIIPQLRGNLKSRPLSEIHAEARGLTDRGVRELVLISQDTTDYGRDLASGEKLRDILKPMLKWKGLDWIRLLYAYPSEVNDDLISLLADEEKLCGYLDMPLQHISDRILKSMSRDWGRAKTLNLLEKLRSDVPHLALRTTFIVGFPGETEEDFQEILETVKEGYFEHVGVFPYSLEKRSPSSHLGFSVPTDVAEERWSRLTEAQGDVARRKAAARIGKRLPVLVERGPDGSWGARGIHQAPEVDGGVSLASLPSEAGIYSAVVTGAEGSNLSAEMTSKKFSPGKSRIAAGVS